jgi:hypothetical protein
MFVFVPFMSRTAGLPSYSSSFVEIPRSALIERPSKTAECYFVHFAQRLHD